MAILNKSKSNLVYDNRRTMMEYELFAKERFEACSEFLGRAFTCQPYFNRVRKNPCKGWQPADIVKKYEIDSRILIPRTVIRNLQCL